MSEAHSTNQQLFEEDPMLAQEIMTFWGDLQRSSASLHRQLIHRIPTAPLLQTPQFNWVLKGLEPRQSKGLQKCAHLGS